MTKVLFFNCLDNRLALRHPAQAGQVQQFDLAVAAADEALASRQRLAKLVAELETLPPRMRRAFQLHKLEGMSHAETARAMGISISAVEKHVSGALKALMGRLG